MSIDSGSLGHFMKPGRKLLLSIKCGMNIRSPQEFGTNKLNNMGVKRKKTNEKVYLNFKIPTLIMNIGGHAFNIRCGLCSSELFTNKGINLVLQLMFLQNLLLKLLSNGLFLLFQIFANLQIKGAL